MKNVDNVWACVNITSAEDQGKTGVLATVQVITLAIAQTKAAEAVTVVVLSKFVS